MWKFPSLLVWTMALLFVLERVPQISCSCNEAICASIVSKCMLTQSCKCDLKNCTCCRDCFNCLGDLYNECCSCVEMCPKSNQTGTPLNEASNVGTIQEKHLELFNALTEEQDWQKRWVVYTFPAHRDLSFFSSTLDKEIKIIAVSSGQNVEKLEEELVNCTVVFMNQCMSLNKCTKSCSSMGASSFRWFHDGCCQCVGDTCLNYGISVSKCLECTAEKLKEDLEGANVDLSVLASNGNDEESPAQVDHVETSDAVQLDKKEE